MCVVIDLVRRECCRVNGVTSISSDDEQLNTVRARARRHQTPTHRPTDDANRLAISALSKRPRARLARPDKIAALSRKTAHEIYSAER